MSDIVFFNRHTGQLEKEAIYGEAGLRWIYGSPLGKVSLHALVKRQIFSKLYGWLMDRPSSAEKIPPFLAQYGLDESEFAEPASSFRSFNEFFSRKLKPTARPIDDAPQSVMFPADGRHLLIENATTCRDFFVKGTAFDLAALLGSKSLAAEYQRASVLISRLCPTDYHRFHFPFSCTPGEPLLLHGPLYSVSPLALMKRPSILWENKRYLTRLADGQAGEALFLEVGATCVGSVVHTNAADEPVQKGTEKGTFLFGGSTVILITKAGTVQWAEDLRHHSSQGRELYAQMGNVAGSWIS